MRALLPFAGLLLCVPLEAQLSIEHVTVIDPRSRAVMPGSTVLVAKDAILAVGSSGGTRTPAGFRRIDGRGRYLIPGLWDCHVHLSKAGRNSLGLFVANGVTSVRDMGSDPAEVLVWRREIEAGKDLGPRIKTSGRILESKANFDRMLREGTVEPVLRIRQPVSDAATAREAVTSLKRAGVDHLKVRTVVSPTVFDELVRAAKEAGLKLTGHAVGKPEEMIGKLASIEHVLAYPPLELQAAERRRLFRKMRDAGTWMSTTLVNFEGSILLPYTRAKELLSAPRTRILGSGLLADWREQLEERKNADEYLTAARKTLPLLVRDIKEMHLEGVNLLAGTDVGVALIYPGFDLHKELAIYASELGLKPMEILRIATHKPAEFFGMESTIGGIAPGQAADLVLLDRNPLNDIRNTASIRTVIYRGRMLDKRTIDGALRHSP